jgi:uncharacterized protein YjbI with pentapeptide repeats
MNGKENAATRGAAQVIVEFDKSLFRRVGSARWNAFAGELVRRGMAPVAWSQGERPPPIGVMLDFRGLRARRCRLGAMDFTFCDLSQADFSGSSLQGAMIGDCPHANLRGTSLQGAEFRGDVSGCDFTGATVEGADFRHAYYEEGDPPIGLPVATLGAVERVTKETDGGPEEPSMNPLRVRATFHEVPW